VEKVPALARKQGAYKVVAAAGVILKRGHDLQPCSRCSTSPSCRWFRASGLQAARHCRARAAAASERNRATARA
jgi:hypothetical protein